MRLIVAECDLPPDPVRLARCIWGRHCPMLLWTRQGEGPSYVACDPIADAWGHDPEPELGLSLDWGPWGNAPRWLGVLPYEAERERLERAKWTAQEQRTQPLIHAARWWRYPAVAVIGPAKVSVVGESAAAVAALMQHLQGAAVAGTRGAARAHGFGSASELDSAHALASLEAQIRARPSGESTAAHRERILRALELIRSGDVYEINLARRLSFDVEGSALALLLRISQWAQSEYCAAMVLPDGAEVISVSPELCLALEPDRQLLTRPIKGTRPRGRDPAQDAELRQELDRDPKERAELSMVIDVERNDLGRVAVIGSVAAGPAYISEHTSVFHRQAEVRALLRPGVTRSELLQAFLPSGSVTGAPKVRAMELIAELESERRGLYTGAFGFLSHDGGLRLAMAIRTLCRRGNLGHYFAGGGIVADSDPDREVLETDWKALQLVRALTGEPAR